MMVDTTTKKPASSATQISSAVPIGQEVVKASLSSRGPELSIIVPTFKERDNVLELVERLQKCLAGCSWEVIFVDDDSPDETAQLVRDIGQRYNRVRCLQRIGRRGLSSACVEGMLASSAPYLAVIDGDLQHDETLLPKMLAVLKEEQTDIVIGTRYAIGNRREGLSNSRAVISHFATRLSRLVLKAELSDPMSGFFMLRREALERSVRKLSGIGFKILLDLFASSPHPLKFTELPFEFRTRKAGASKLDTQAVWAYVMLLMDKLIGHIIPVRFVAFSLVGGFGVVIHLAVLTLLFNVVATSFTAAQSIATLAAMTSNFVLNNILTYRDKRLRGWQWVWGWVSFNLACGIGALANVGIASYLFARDIRWILAGLAGILVGAVWNYAVTTVYTWKK